MSRKGEEFDVQLGWGEDMGLPLPSALSSHSSRHFVSTVPKEVPGGHSLRVSAAHAHFAAKPMAPPRSMEATHRGLVIYGGVGQPPRPADNRRAGSRGVSLLEAGGGMYQIYGHLPNLCIVSPFDI